MRTYAMTGSASGIGAATRALLEARGDRVIGIDLHDAEVTADLSIPAGRATMVDDVARLSGGRLDGVVASAGIGGGLNRPELIIRINFFGARATLEGLRPFLAATDAPRAVVLASIAALSPGNDEGIARCLADDEEGAIAACAGDGPRAYATSKRAIARWAKLAAVTPAWAGAGIALNAVAPGMVLSPMSEYYLGTEEMRAAALARIPQPFKGVGRPEDIARLISFLVGPENGMVTGQVIFADGGYQATVCPGELPEGRVFTTR